MPSTYVLDHCPHYISALGNIKLKLCHLYKELITVKVSLQ